MTFELIEDVVELALVVSSLYAAFGLYVHIEQPIWSATLRRRRLAVVWTLALVVVAIKVTEDVTGGESGPIDQSILAFVGDHVPSVVKPFFEAITWTGSAACLVPLTSAGAMALWVRRRRVEAALLVTSTIGAAGVVYVLKAVVGRARPELWATKWYWGSSFPSGHTLVVAAFATAAALCVARIWPASSVRAAGVAFAWTLLVALSRLVLGVHWPTDVLAAACIGVALPMTLSLVRAFGRV